MNHAHRGFRLLAAGIASLALIASTNTSATGTEPTATIGTVKKKPFVVVINGTVTFKKMTDSTYECNPGRKWVVNNTLTFKTSGVTKASATSTSLPSQNFRALSFTKMKAGTISYESFLSDQAETNYCGGEPGPLPEAPVCKSQTGKANFVLLGQQPGPDTPTLLGLPLVLTVWPTTLTGAMSDNGCATKAWTDFDDADLMQMASSPLILNSQSFVAYTSFYEDKLMKFKKNKLNKRTIYVTGDCFDPTYRSGNYSSAPAAPAIVTEDGDCAVSGKVDIWLKALK